MVKIGSKWSDSEGKLFHVINRVDFDDKIWIFYKLEKSQSNENIEFNCSEESFLIRFFPFVNQ